MENLNHITHENLKQWAKKLGFEDLGISNIDLGNQEIYLKKWLSQDFHGDMEWMKRHGNKRTRPAELVPDTMSIISVRMNYRPPQTHDPEMVLNHPNLAYISRYALGRDYHKLMRKRLQQLAKKIESEIDHRSDTTDTSLGTDNKSMQYRVFVDSAPVMEKPIAVKAGLGWVGKHTNVLNQESGSWFFLGEIYTNLPLQQSDAVKDHCGDCSACIDVCPTKAIIKPYQLDARLCISYLTIEHKGAIPEELRAPIGSRIYGCDDCQLICPWNRFAVDATLADFAVRNNLETPYLLDLFAWSELQFLKKLEGSPIRRIGYERWQRNIAIALGNAPFSNEIILALKQKNETASEMVREHINWALQRQKTSI